MKRFHLAPLFQLRRRTLERAIGYHRWRFVSYRGRLWGWPRKELPLTHDARLFLDRIINRLPRLK